jgi:polyketide synthase PksN
MAESVKELEEKLQGFAEGQDAIEDLYRGQVKRNKEALAVFAADEDMAKTIDAWITKGKYAKLLDLWVKGLIVDWRKLYGENTPRRISLPTYPFARERYWASDIKTTSVDRTAATPAIAAPVHPQEAVNHQDKSPASRQFLPSLQSAEPSVPDKPRGIALPSLSEEQPTSKPASHLQHAITLSAIDTPVPHAVIADGSQPPAVVRESIPQEGVEKELATSLAEALYMHVDDIDVNKKFIDMGLDSILGVEWVRAVNKQYGTSIPVTRVYDYPTIREFAGFVLNGMNTAFSRDLPVKKSESLPAAANPGVRADERGEAETEHNPRQSAAWESIEKELATSLAEALYMQVHDIDVHKKFIDMGLDSIIGVEWVRAVNKRYGTSIPVTKVYDYPTTREFAGFMERELNRPGGGSARMPQKAAAAASVDELLQSVQQGVLDIEQADRLLHQFRE